MVKEAFRITDNQEELGDILLGGLAWVETREMRVVVEELHNLIYIDIYLDYHEVLDESMHFAAEKVKVRASLVGLAARAVAERLGREEEVEELAIPRGLRGEVWRLVGGVGPKSNGI